MKVKYAKEHFINLLLEEGKIPSFYNELKFRFDSKLYYEQNVDFLSKKEITSLIVTCIAFPNFFEPFFANLSLFSVKKIKQKYREGFGVVINPKYNNIAKYLNSHFSKNSRAPIIKKIKRLESCFNINYKVFYGYIEKNNYDYLMNKAFAMLVRRFEQKNDSNFILNNWEKYYDTVYPLINKSNASMFVIYNNEDPIQISINFHYSKIFFAFIPAYDIDYGQFGLGNTAIYKQLEWCIENKYEYLDMGNGDLEYKLRWCNYSYDLETHIYYRKRSVKAYLIASKEIAKIKMVNALKTLKNNHLVQKLFSLKKNKLNSNFTGYISEYIDATKANNIENMVAVDLQIKKLRPEIKKALCDFLYATREHLESISLYKSKDDDAYLIKGSEKSIKVSFQDKL